jgi:hypothetical protein
MDNYSLSWVSKVADGSLILFTSYLGKTNAVTFERTDKTYHNIPEHLRSLPVGESRVVKLPLLTDRQIVATPHLVSALISQMRLIDH